MAAQELNEKTKGKSEILFLFLFFIFGGAFFQFHKGLKGEQF